MADERRLRVGGWVRTGGDVPEQGVPGEDPQDRTAVDPGDPDHPYEQLDDPTVAIDPNPTDPGGGSYRGRRRRDDERVTMRRLFAIAIMVGALLVGVGVMARSLAPDPVTLPKPPATPEGSEPVDPTRGTARLGPAPTGTPETTPTPAPTARPDDDSSGQDPPGPAPPSPTTPPTTPPIASYEAENASLGEQSRVVSLGAASGGEVVEFTSGAPKSNLEHSGVTAGGSGRYRLTIHYFGDRHRSVAVSVNGGPVATVSLPAPDDAETPGAVTLSVDLSAGANTVHVRNNDGSGVRIDRITIAE